MHTTNASILTALYASARHAKRILPPLFLAVTFLLTNSIAAQAQGCVPLPPYGNEADRIGVNVITDYGKTLWDYDTDKVAPGWFIDYGANPSLGRSVSTSSAEGTVSLTAMAYAPIMRISDLEGNWRIMVQSLVGPNPGMLWIIGNEPDRHMQDQISPQEYAVIYHDAYAFIKEKDPTANVAIAAVVEPTPLRRKYYELILEEYKRLYGDDMPIDVWSLHTFILRESNEWGAGIPTGLDEYADMGILYDVADHGDIEILKGLIIDFRAWMASKGYQDTPLIITEYGILMAPYYTANDGRLYDAEFISEYIRDTFDFFLSARNTATGYPGDDYRLVQAWSWFGLNNYVFSEPDHTFGFNGNLFDHDTAELTEIGKAFADYTSKLSTSYVDYAFRKCSAPKSIESSALITSEITIDLSVYNRGNLRAPASRINVWLGFPESNGKLLQSEEINVALGERCRGVFDTTISVKIPDLDDGLYSLVVDIDGASTSVDDPLPDNDRLIIPITVGDAANWTTTFVPDVAQ